MFAGEQAYSPPSSSRYQRDRATGTRPMRLRGVVPGVQREDPIRCGDYKELLAVICSRGSPEVKIMKLTSVEVIKCLVRSTLINEAAGSIRGLPQRHARRIQCGRDEP